MCHKEPIRRTTTGAGRSDANRPKPYNRTVQTFTTTASTTITANKEAYAASGSASGKIAWQTSKFEFAKNGNTLK